MTIIIALNFEGGALLFSDCTYTEDKTYKTHQDIKHHHVIYNDHDHLFFASSGRVNNGLNRFLKEKSEENKQLSRYLSGFNERNSEDMARTFARTTNTHNNGYVFMGIFDGEVRMGSSIFGELKLDQKCIAIGSGVDTDLIDKLKELSEKGDNQQFDYSVEQARDMMNNLLFHRTEEFKGYEALRIDKAPKRLHIKYSADLNTNYIMANIFDKYRTTWEMEIPRRINLN